jgi:hypothetical protein
LYFLAQLLKLYAIRFEQQRFSILSYARNPCPEAVWINLKPHFGDFEAVIRFWHG